MSVSDNGIGMSEQDLNDALGTIASSGTRAFLDRTLVGALALRATLSPAQRSAFMLRAKQHERAARRHATELAAEGSGDRVALAQARADILEELAKPAPDETRMRTLGSAFATSHTASLQELR